MRLSPAPQPAGAGPHPLSPRVRLVPAAAPPAPPVPAARTRTARSARPALRIAARATLFYALAATLIVAGVAVHEYSHYAAHEGFGVPAFEVHDSVEAAQRDLLVLERSRGEGGDVLVQQPRETTIVLYPNTFVQAAGLGLLPTSAYRDDGVLASTYFHLDHAEVQGLQARGGHMPDAVVAAPLWVAVGIFVAALAWTLWRPGLFSKALLVAYAVQLGDAGHHATAIGLAPEVFALLSTVAIMVAALLVGLRMFGAPPRSAPGRGGPATRVVLAAPTRRPRMALSVPGSTDKSRTRAAAKPQTA